MYEGAKKQSGSPPEDLKANPQLEGRKAWRGTVEARGLGGSRGGAPGPSEPFTPVSGSVQTLIPSRVSPLLAEAVGLPLSSLQTGYGPRTRAASAGVVRVPLRVVLSAATFPRRGFRGARMEAASPSLSPSPRAGLPSQPAQDAEGLGDSRLLP